MFLICSIMSIAPATTLKFTDSPSKLRLNVFSSRVPAEFPSPADDHIEGKLDLNEHLVRRPAATFFVRASGESMRDAGIFDGDLLIIDRSIAAKGTAPLSLFDAVAPKDDGLMNAMDTINQRYGRGSIGLGLAGKDQDWRMRRENLSPSFTTKWADLPCVTMG